MCVAQPLFHMRCGRVADQWSSHNFMNCDVWLHSNTVREGEKENNRPLQTTYWEFTCKLVNPIENDSYSTHLHYNLHYALSFRYWVFQQLTLSIKCMYIVDTLELKSILFETLGTYFVYGTIQHIYTLYIPKIIRMTSYPYLLVKCKIITLVRKDSFYLSWPDKLSIHWQSDNPLWLLAVAYFWPRAAKPSRS